MQSLALLNKRLRATRVDKAHCVRSADAGSFARDYSLALPARYALAYASKRESRFLGHYRSLLKAINAQRATP